MTPYGRSAPVARFAVRVSRDPTSAPRPPAPGSCPARRAPAGSSGSGSNAVEVEGRGAGEPACSRRTGAPAPAPCRCRCCRRRCRRRPRAKSSDAPSSLVRELLRVCGRMKAPLSPSARTGSRLVSVRESTKLLLVRNRGRSQDVRLGVRRARVVTVRSRSTPTGMPRKNSPLAVGQAAERASSPGRPGGRGCWSGRRSG